MQTRIDQTKVSPGALNAMLGLEKHLSQGPIPKPLRDLVNLRVSQINGCAFCIDMHWKDLRAAGENEQRLYGLDAWAESPYYTDRERAALAWAEGVTRVAENHVPDALFQETRRYFSEAEMVDLTLGVVAINGWNRLNIAFRAPAGSYQPVTAPRTTAPTRRVSPQPSH
jgi:AhpD family alkylhydroperoxidase